MFLYLLNQCQWLTPEMFEVLRFQWKQKILTELNWFQFLVLSGKRSLSYKLLWVIMFHYEFDLSDSILFYRNLLT